MKIYNLVVHSGQYDDARSWTEGIFSTEERALEAKKALEDFIVQHNIIKEEIVEPEYDDDNWNDWFEKYRIDWYNDFTICQIQEVLLDVFTLPY